MNEREVRLGELMVEFFFLCTSMTLVYDPAAAEVNKFDKKKKKERERGRERTRPILPQIAIWPNKLVK